MRRLSAKRFQRGLLLPAVIAAPVLGASLAHGSRAYAGPCTTAIAALERQIDTIVPGPQSGPTASQAIGAQLHHQPTPGSVEHAERIANKDADAALARARKADAAGDAVRCRKALNEARDLYGLNK